MEAANYYCYCVCCLLFAVCVLVLVFGVGVLIGLDIFWCTVARAARRAREYVDRYYLVDKYHTTKGEDADIGGHLRIFAVIEDKKGRPERAVKLAANFGDGESMKAHCDFLQGDISVRIN